MKLQDYILNPSKIDHVPMILQIEFLFNDPVINLSKTDHVISIL